ncbi:hypothetical protein [Rubinisphaera sp.]|uniref:hypothetical protein n=1 Tax=Rubinisphaera sp. TaxID=2024857 RepID=UPI000C0FCB6F|nr:hypothetical protein [Rubinisphaera sp.]MBV08761.1 hypothetical protein [Rubinisphaera sp.]|tara:strand:+ start:726 stop:2117 length:1392 start_codon:yes stop_codon:yes gene_type:complete
MISKHLACCTYLAVFVSANLTFGQFKEPNYAPAQQGVIQSPRIIPKNAHSSNQELMKLVDEAIEVSSRRYLIANEHSPWQIYHGMNAYRNEFLVDYNGTLVPASDWLSQTNPQFRGLPWFEKTVHGGRAHRFTKPYHFEGHPNQSLALMVMCNFPYQHTFQTNDGPITVQNIIDNAKADLNPREELTWTLWFLTHYLDEEDTWMTRRGETWNLEKLVENQIQTQVTEAACGGTHNLYALSVARNNHVRNGGEIRGVWLQADQKVKRYLVAAKSLQRPDGSFPTNYFRGYGYPKSFSEQIASSGHMMEWIVVGADQSQLDDKWIEQGIQHISEKLIKYRDESAECGPLYHAVSALVLYRERINGVAWPRPEQGPSKSTPLPAASTLTKIQEQPAGSEPATMTPEQSLEAKPLPEKTATKPADVAEQAIDGKISISIDETELSRKPVATKPVEILIAPEDATIIK